MADFFIFNIICQSVFRLLSYIYHISDYNINITDIEVKNGAGYIVVYTGKILTMPGLPKEPNYEKIDLINDEITGIF